MPLVMIEGRSGSIAFRRLADGHRLALRRRGVALKRISMAFGSDAAL